jgi:hypothetical protein
MVLSRGKKNTSSSELATTFPRTLQGIHNDRAPPIISTSSFRKRWLSKFYIKGDVGPLTPTDKKTRNDQDSSTDDSSRYGYGDESPDDGEAATSAADQAEDNNKYGYEDAAPDAAPLLKSSFKRNNRRRASLGAAIANGTEITVHLPGQKNPVRRRTSITFNDNEQVKEVASVKSLTTESKQKMWYKDEDYQTFADKSRMAVDAADLGQDTSNERNCIRGLEGYTMKGSRVKSENRNDAWDSVLIEQGTQWADGVFDAEYMALLYGKSTRMSEIQAAQRAQQDSADVQNYLKSTRRVIRRSSIA